MMRLFSCIFAKSQTKQLLPVKSESRTSSSSWPDLPPDILRSIAECIDVCSAARLSVVCTSWALAIRLYLGSFASFNLNQRIPLLLLSAGDSETNPNCTNLTFYDLTTASSYSISIPIPTLHDHQWLGCSKGWLVTLDPKSQIHLIKPHTDAHLLLPSIGTEIRPRKVILYRTPDDSDGYAAFSITNRGFFFITPGSKKWAWLYDTTLDVAFYRGKIYSPSSTFLDCLSFQGSSVILEKPIHISDRWQAKTLFKWRGALLVLCTNEKPASAPQKCACIQVKLLAVQDNSWSCVTSLRDDALFVSNNHTHTVSTSGIGNVRRNCIYFTDHLWPSTFPSGIHSNCFYGVYDLLNGTCKYMQYSTPDSHTHRHPPFWFWPC